MTIHTIWGDFESEEELIKTGARMMGISYDKAKAIRQNALKEYEEKKKRIEKAIQERKDLEQSILDKIKAKFPDLHFKPCPWCGEEPHIEVSVGRDYWLGKGEKPQTYFVKLHSCEHLDKTGSVLNSYDIDEIPDQPTHPNPKYTWTGAWEDHGWEYAVKHYEEYLSDDYPRKCAKCGKKWRGYEDYSIPEVDGKQYCWECCELFDHWDNHIPFVKDTAQYYCDARNLSTMYDGGPQFYTSLQKVLEGRGIKETDIEVEFKGTGERRGSDRLTGSLTGERYMIYYIHKKPDGIEKWFIAYVRQPRDKEELEKYLKRGDLNGNRIDNCGNDPGIRIGRGCILADNQTLNRWVATENVQTWEEPYVGRCGIQGQSNHQENHYKKSQMFSNRWIKHQSLP